MQSAEVYENWASRALSDGAVAEAQVYATLAVAAAWRGGHVVYLDPPDPPEMSTLGGDTP